MLRMICVKWLRRPQGATTSCRAPRSHRLSWHGIQRKRAAFRPHQLRGRRDRNGWRRQPCPCPSTRRVQRNRPQRRHCNLRSGCARPRAPTRASTNTGTGPRDIHSPSRRRRGRGRSRAGRRTALTYSAFPSGSTAYVHDMVREQGCIDDNPQRMDLAGPVYTHIHNLHIVLCTCYV